MIDELTKRIAPSDNRLQYEGRIDFCNQDAPVFVYPCTSVRLRFRGTAIGAVLTNIHGYYESSVGVIVDGMAKKIVLTDSAEQRIVLADDLSPGEHEVILYKRMDACHYLAFHGFQLDVNAEVLALPELPKRRMEFYGDSVTAGEVSELVDYCGKADPTHNGEFSNSWHSYAWYTARKLNAQIHDIAQGGIALMKGTGYFCAPELYGMEYMYDKIQYNPQIGEAKEWDFSRYSPHVVVIAVGQNDNYPDDYMETDIGNPKALEWRRRYAAFVMRIRALYPNAVIILSTTILNHGVHWDDAIDTVQKELNDPKIYHFLYSNNGRGTPGHIRAPEAEKMAQELSAFIESLGDSIWED